MIKNSTQRTIVKEKNYYSLTPFWEDYWNANRSIEDRWSEDLTIGEDSKISYEDSRAFYKNCVHTMNKVSMKEPGRRTYTTTPDPGWSYHTTGAVRLAYFYNNGYLQTPSYNMNPTYDSLSWMLDRAIDDLRPKVSDISGGFSATNFIAELRDVKDMFKLWDKSISIAKNFSSGVLNWNFAWKPTIQDAQTVHKSLAVLQKTVDKWNRKAREGTVVTRYWNGSDYIQSDDSFSDYYNASPWQGTIDMVDTNYSRKEKFIVNLAYKPKPISLNEFDKIMFYFDYYGLGKGLSIPWEGTKLSFVIDWFLSVGDFLEQFESDTFVFPYEVVHFGYSSKVEVEVVHSYRQGRNVDPAEHFAPPGAKLTSVQKKYVRRRIPVPTEKEGIDWGRLRLHLPSVGQAWLGLNLINVFRK